MFNYQKNTTKTQKALRAYHRFLSKTGKVCGFEIKREEKYFVFIWMSRKERVIA